MVVDPEYDCDDVYGPIREPTQKELLARITDLIAERDRLRAENTTLYAENARICSGLHERRGAMEIIHENARLKAELEAFKAAPSRPVAIVRLSGGKWHVFEDETEARRFVVEKVNACHAVDAFSVSEWHWHSRGG